jgi:hypothetical protein
VSSGVEDLRTTNHALGTRHKVRLHHHRSTHLCLLGRHVLRIVGEAPELAHLWCSRAHINMLVVRDLTRGIDSRIRHSNLPRSRRRKRLRRVRVYHSMIIVSVRRVTSWSMLRSMHLHVRQVRRLPLAHVLTALL